MTHTMGNKAYVQPSVSFEHEIFIPYNVPSSKNSNMWTGRHLIKSKLVMDYYENTKHYWYEAKEFFVERMKQRIARNMGPYVGLYFIRSSSRKFDYINPGQTIQDRMVKWGWLDDDNADLINPIYLGYEVDNANPGVIIRI